MTRDKQLLHVDLARVLDKRRLDQALNVKEFAVLAGVSYSAARAWFRQAGFPAFCGVVFWRDFEQWRNAKNGLNRSGEEPARSGERHQTEAKKPAPVLTGKAAQILAEA
jgi:hypothetical protein